MLLLNVSLHNKAVWLVKVELGLRERHLTFGCSFITIVLPLPKIPSPDLTHFKGNCRLSLTHLKNKKKKNILKVVSVKSYVLHTFTSFHASQKVMSSLYKRSAVYYAVGRHIDSHIMLTFLLEHWIICLDSFCFILYIFHSNQLVQSYGETFTI